MEAASTALGRAALGGFCEGSLRLLQGHDRGLGPDGQDSLVQGRLEELPVQIEIHVPFAEEVVELALGQLPVLEEAEAVLGRELLPLLLVDEGLRAARGAPEPAVVCQACSPGPCRPFSCWMSTSMSGE